VGCGDPVDYCSNGGSPSSPVSYVERRLKPSSASIPTEIGLLTGVTKIKFSTNSGLTGTIPTELTKMTSLRTCVFVSNPILSGSLPALLGSLSNLQILKIMDNALLSGSLPDLSKLSKLSNLQLFTLKLNGTIPAAVWLLPLSTLAFSALGKLSGTLHTEIGLCLNLSAL